MKKVNVFSVSFWICLSVSIILIVVGFILPPRGVIDGSVLTAAGELLGFAVLGMLPKILSKAKSTRVSTPSGTSIEIETHDKEHNGENC